MPWPRFTSERRGHSHGTSNGNPQPIPPQTTAHNPHNYNQPFQGAQGTPAPTGWSSYPSGVAQGSVPASPMQGGRPQLGYSPNLGGYSRDGGAYAGGSSQPSNPRVANRPIAHTNSFSSHAPQAPPLIAGRDECRDLFNAIDQDGNGLLNSEELRHALLNDGGKKFSPDTVKYLMSVFDVDGDGMIGFDEFKALRNYVTDWQRVFKSFDKDRDGRINASELDGALAYYHISVSPRIIDMVVNKYGTAPSWDRQPSYGGTPQMDLDRFMCACVVVQQMCRLYARAPQISIDDFLQTVISLP